MAKDATFDGDDRALLDRLAGNAEIDDVWTSIVRKVGPQNLLYMRFFIRYIIDNHNLAKSADVWPDHLKYARHAEILAAGLKENGVRYIVLPPNLSDIPQLLDQLAVTLRASAQRRLVRVSRENVAGSRAAHLFMQLQSMTMQNMFDRWFDNEVAFLTNAIFPKRAATNDSVRGARRSQAGKIALTKVASS